MTYMTHQTYDIYHVNVWVDACSKLFVTTRNIGCSCQVVKVDARANWYARFPIVCQSHKPCCGSLPTRLVVGNNATTSLVGIPSTANTVGKLATTKLLGTCFTTYLVCSHKLCGNTFHNYDCGNTSPQPTYIEGTTFSRQI